MEHEATSAIQELSEEEDFKLRVIQLHYDTLKHCVPSATIPTVMTDAMLMYMLQNYGESEESRLWGFVQMKRNMERLPKVLRTPVIPDKEPAKITKGTLGPLSNTIVLFDRKRMVAHCYNEVCFNMTQRPPIVIDFTYSVAKKWNSVHGEVNDCFRDNLIRRTPHFFQLCNIPQDDEFSPMRERLMENLGPECPYLVTDKSYTDLHPKEKLIYMTNASLNILETYDPNAVYVFANSQRLASLPKDKILLDVEKRGIRTARIPEPRELLKSPGTSNNAEASIKPSKRPSFRSEEEEDALGLSPSYRAHVASKLSSILDDQIEEMLNKSSNHEEDSDADSNSGFRLFATSTGKAPAPVVTTQRRRKISSSSDSDLENARLAEAAVSSDMILAGSSMSSTKIVEENKEVIEEPKKKKIKKKKKKKD
ncbi:hypothetical protein CAPTEDRAFT_202265 [Capitella teleta]|uniref:Protein CUSTOS n=1 Tax=Capitella teleta TaxID=283909 RepID=R7V1L2_CAPTE|nr:hypothetical protein CAPTEDRAFT_202265 [Capitella teleta]|eukprot:ELU12728.1 hypothetical protein CAPTEDRAFT_202265 [Capitella teleta]